MGSTGIKNDCVQTHPARPGLPELALGAAHPGKLLPGLAAIYRLEQRRVLHSRVNGARIVQRRVEFPDTFELPRMLRATVPLVSAGNALITDLCAGGSPEFTPLLRPLNHPSSP